MLVGAYTPQSQDALLLILFFTDSSSALSSGVSWPSSQAALCSVYFHVTCLQASPWPFTHTHTHRSACLPLGPNLSSQPLPSAPLSETSSSRKLQHRLCSLGEACLPVLTTPPAESASESEPQGLTASLWLVLHPTTFPFYHQGSTCLFLSGSPRV